MHEPDTAMHVATCSKHPLATTSHIVDVLHGVMFLKRTDVLAHMQIYLSQLNRCNSSRYEAQPLS